MKKILFFLLIALNIATAGNYLPKVLTTSVKNICLGENQFYTVESELCIAPVVITEFTVDIIIKKSPKIVEKLALFYQDPSDSNCKKLLDQIMIHFGFKSKLGYFREIVNYFYKNSEFNRSISKIKEILLNNDNQDKAENIEFLSSFISKWYKKDIANNEHKFNALRSSSRDTATKILLINKNKDTILNDQLMNKVLKKAKDALSPSSIDDVKSAEKIVKKGLQKAYKVFMKFRKYAR